MINSDAEERFTAATRATMRMRAMQAEWLAEGREGDPRWRVSLDVFHALASVFALAYRLPKGIGLAPPAFASWPMLLDGELPPRSILLEAVQRRPIPIW